MLLSSQLEGGVMLLQMSKNKNHCYPAVCVLVSSGFDWEWDDHFKSPGAFLSCDNRKVSFHSDYSCGTAAIRGTKELADGQHFWEVKMTSPVYGTDMVGIKLAQL